MRIAHIADLHLSPSHRRQNIRRTRLLLEYISRLEVDHLVVAGDIAADAQPEDLQLARSLLTAHGFLDPNRLSVVPGNHDIFGGVHDAEDLLSFPRRCRRTDYVHALRGFRHFFRETFDHTISPGASGFPYAKVVGETVFIGVNSIAGYSRVKNPLGSNGAVGDEQRGAIAALLDSPSLRGKTKIVVVHHHFQKPPSCLPGAMHTIWGAVERHTMKLRRKKELLKVFREHDVRLVLHGHDHRNSDYVRDGIRFLNAGGSILGPARDELLVNLIDIRAGRSAVEVHHLPLPPRAQRVRTRPRSGLSPVPARVPLAA